MTDFSHIPPSFAQTFEVTHMKRLGFFLLALLCAAVLAACVPASGAGEEHHLPALDDSDTQTTVNSHLPETEEGLIPDGTEKLPEEGEEPDEGTPPTEDSPPATPEEQHTHVWVETGKTDPTCTAQGKTVYTCSSCSNTKTETQNAAGHRFGSWVTTVSPTTSSTGTKTRTCAVCSATENETLPKLTAPTPSLYLEILRLLNEERANAGLPALSYYTKGQEAADIRAREGASVFSHTRPDGRECFSVFDDLNLPDFMCAENLASGQISAEEVMSDWMNSEGHRANILDDYPNAVVISRYNDCWVQLFVNI